MSTDNVNDPINPSHYKSHPIGVEYIQITEHYNFNVGNAIKYLWRAGKKEGVSASEDLQKALWYINREIIKVTGMEVLINASQKD